MSEPEEMGGFEQQLKRALGRVNAPETMAAFLMKAAEAEAERNVPWWQRRHRWVFAMPRAGGWASGALAASVIGLCVFGGVEHHTRAEEHAKAERNFALSLQITDEALAQTREQLQRAGVQLDQQ